MKRLYLSIYWKLYLSIILTVMLFGFLNIVLVWNKVYDILDDEISKRGINVAKNVANQSVHYLLYSDLSSLQAIVDNTVQSDEIILYCFIVDSSRKLIVHSFEEGFPKQLLQSHTENVEGKILMQTIKAYNLDVNSIKDIMVPILDGKIGYVRLGLSNDYIWSSLQVTFVRFIAIFIGFTLLGFFGAYLFAFYVSKPIKRIKKITEEFDLENLANFNLAIVSNKSDSRNRFLNLKIDDEIDDLVYKFDEMIIRLERTYEQLIATQNAMIQSEKLASIGVLVAGIAHEINNPLSGLQTCIRRISDAPNRIEQNIKYFGIMVEAVRKIQNVVDSLLNFTHASNVKKSYCKVSEMFDNALNLIKYGAMEETFKIDIDDSVNTLVLLCNKNQMEQVFFNLLKNAYDSLEERKKLENDFLGRIEIKANLNEDSLIISFWDNGVGISKNDINKVIEPFYTTKDVGKGTGLGCSICYNIVKEHGGEFQIESEPMNWTKFSLVFSNTIFYTIENE